MALKLDPNVKTNDLGSRVVPVQCEWERVRMNVKCFYLTAVKAMGFRVKITTHSSRA